MGSEDKSEKSGTWEIVPARLVAPAVPLPGKEAINDGTAKTGDEAVALPLEGVSTLPGSVEEAGERGEALIAKARRHVEQRDVPAFFKLLDQYPTLISDAWIREKLVDLARENRLRKTRGRPAGRFKIHPLVLIGWVKQLMASGAAKNIDRAFGLLEERGWMSYETAKDLYYQALKEERFRSILLTLPGEARRASEEEMARLGRAEKLRPGGSITRTATNEDGETIEVTFAAKPTK